MLIFSLMNLSAQEKLDPSPDSSVAKGVDLILKQDYIKADSLFCDLIDRYPDHPAGYLYRAAVMQAYALDFDVSIEEKKFDSLLDLGRNAASHVPSPWREYFIGTADGYEAYERIESGAWLSGVQKGMVSASEFEDLVEKDSSFYEAYIGIGTYYYWSSRETAFIRWLPFVRDNRELGIRMLRAGAERSKYNRFAAISALISIYIDAEDYRQAEEWSQRGLNFYPENRVFLWGLATALDRQKHYLKAIPAYKNLLKNILNVQAPHPYNEIVCRLNLVKSMLQVSDTTNYESHLGKILSYENAVFPDDLQERAQMKFQETRILLSTIKNKHAAIK
jgi:tetratricopeptide (TPR) repeat protein